MTRQVSKNDESLNISQESAPRTQKHAPATQPLPGLHGENKLKDKRARRGSGISDHDSFDRRFGHSKLIYENQVIFDIDLSHNETKKSNIGNKSEKIDTQLNKVSRKYSNEYDYKNIKKKDDFYYEDEISIVSKLYRS